MQIRSQKHRIRILCLRVLLVLQLRSQILSIIVTGVSLVTSSWRIGWHRTENCKDASTEARSLSWAKQFSFTCKGLNQKFPRRWGERTLDGQGIVDRRAHVRNAGRQAAGAHRDTKARTQEMVQGFVCAGGLFAKGTKGRYATRSAGTAAGALDAYGPRKGLDPRLGARHTLELVGKKHSRVQN